MARKSESAIPQEGVVQTQARTLFERVTDFATAKELRFLVVEEGRCISFGTHLRDANVRVFLSADEFEACSRLLVHCCFPTFVPANRRQAIADAVNRVNFVNFFSATET